MNLPKNLLTTRLHASMSSPLLVAIQPESGCRVLAGARDSPLALNSFPAVFMGRAERAPSLCYGGWVAGGSQGPSVKSRVRASRAPMPHLAVVDR